MTKSELLEKVRISRAEFESVMMQFSETQMLEPGLPGGWTPKDALAHIAWWERRAYSVISTVLGGGLPEYSVEEEDVDSFNRSTYENNLKRPLGEISAEEASAFRLLLIQLESMSESDLFDTQKFSWTKGRPLATLAEWNTFGHYEEHLPDLLKMLGK